MPKIFGFYYFRPKTLLALIFMVSFVLITGSVLVVEAYNRQKPIYEIRTDKKILALTFDISWGNQTPIPVLDILKENNIKCTFFLSGPWVKQYPDIANRIKEDGHEIASHGYRHINLSQLSKSEIKEEIEKAHKAIKEVTGVDARLIRTPNGDYKNHVIEAIHECGYEAIQWGTDSLDWMNPGVNTIIERVTKKAHPGDIILMHASDSCKQTTEALPVIIKELKKQGYQFVTVSELLKEAKTDQDKIN
ncbi:polysaccharide deacetylase family sporulation protein PdaB [Thermosyntropha lipolytica DSM 11003]|uniref:Polysaccharide deacetylase family sporulation protein PdaB n=1 Tax=Thermosyntropha lipolytica DSM 11003 TaxID=1123382 RepID=A0A1M5K3N0_9FIRM|nr:polysaccharide deacetylase family sporulation protein PdaB [Thermosyntropha lipolytica]SHG47345.1 polysaccharide deacetylase family sporulation protein PdaB [Thermosyntropha lipolytica DSM 11003]